MEGGRLSAADVEAARLRIKDYVYKTPLEKSIYLSSGKRSVFLKLECQQPVKAYKIRGALNKLLLLSAAQKDAGVAAVSSGNHGISVAYGAQLLGIGTAKIIVPETTPQSKIDRIRYYGGDVLLMGGNFDGAYAQGKTYIKESGLTYIDGWDDDPDVYAGQGTIALEILEQNPDIDTILAPIGGGGLCTGIAVVGKSKKPGLKVIPLCSEACTAWPDGIRDGRHYHEYPGAPSVCDAMVGGIGHLAYDMREWLDPSLTVKESFIRAAMAHAVLKEKIVAEASGAVPIAAILQYGDEIPGKNIALVISGGNVDTDLLIDIISSMK
ncbi:threonine ammonia-lyase [Spirochaetia bacterium]|nr:threonine ammonia-lyase [Spirochaetia bacterium]